MCVTDTLKPVTNRISSREYVSVSITHVETTVRHAVSLLYRRSGGKLQKTIPTSVNVSSALFHSLHITP